MKNSMVLLLALVLPSACYAENQNDVKVFRCGNNYGAVGDSGATLMKKCGEPTSIRPTKEWVYDQGPSEFVYDVFVSSNGVWKITRTDERGRAKKK